MSKTNQQQFLTAWQLEKTLSYKCKKLLDISTLAQSFSEKDSVRVETSGYQLHTTILTLNYKTPSNFFSFTFPQVYIPLLSFNSHKNGEGSQIGDQQAALSSTSQEDLDEESDDEDLSQKQKLVESQHRAMLRDEFLINMQKFATHIGRTIQQIEGEVRLDIPQMNLDGDVAELAKDDNLIHKIVATCLEWTKQIASALEI